MNLKKFVELTIENDGSTYNLNTGEINPSNGYFVAIGDIRQSIKSIAARENHVFPFIYIFNHNGYIIFGINHQRIVFHSVPPV